MVAASAPPQLPSSTLVPEDRPPEPHAAVTESGAEMPLPSNPQTILSWWHFRVERLATLYLASHPSGRARLRVETPSTGWRHGLMVNIAHSRRIDIAVNYHRRRNACGYYIWTYL